MKFTKEELLTIINEELDTVLEQSDVEDHDGDGAKGEGFPSDVPFVDYEEAKDDSEAGILPQLRQANDNRPVFFMTKIRDNDYPSVYTKYKPGTSDAKRYQKMGVKLIWADSRYGIGNWSPKSIIGIHKTNQRMRRDAEIYGNYHYLPENIDEMIDEEMQSMEGGDKENPYMNEATGKSPMAYLSGDRNNARVDFTGIGASKIGWKLPLNKFRKYGPDSPQLVYDALVMLANRGGSISDFPEIHQEISQMGITFKGEPVSAEDIGSAKVVGG